MKLRLLNSLFVLFICVSAGAQVGFNGGITAGAITSQVHGDGYGGFNKIGINAGAFIILRFSETNAFRIDMLYAQKGSRNKPDTEAGDFTTYKLILDYIEIPLLYSWRFRDEISFEFGPYAARLINSGEEYSGGSSSLNAYNDWDYGAVAGISYELNEHFIAIARYSQSILPIRSAPSTAQQTARWDSGGSNHALHLMIGFKF